ncbi:MAG: exo-alpha-sialidase [Actinobacteria bacterium]|jgi:hypothetical protein|nr:exo-alpha-sialidase [Actinomycetota bacterium]MCL6094263.1 exo-alpha-sialidase [Actinomycetota bacterium]
MIVETINYPSQVSLMLNAPSFIQHQDRLHCFFFGGDYECAPRTALWHAWRPFPSSGELLPHGFADQHWNIEPLVLEDDVFQGNSVPVEDGGKLWLFFVTGSGTNWEKSRIRTLVSDDNGLSWSERHVLDLPPGWMVGTAALTTSWNELILPLYHERAGIGRFAIFSVGNMEAGPTVLSGVISSDSWLIQPAIVEWHGELLGFLRSRSGYLFKSKSTDRGRTWEQALSTDIPNPNSRIAVASLGSGEIVMAYNPLRSGVIRFGPGQLCSGREILRVARSLDGALSWPRELRGDLAYGTGEYGYPWIVITSRGDLGVGYQHSRVVIKLAWLQGEHALPSTDGGSQSFVEEQEWLVSMHHSSVANGWQ